jgi:hypothetical protein
MEDDQNIDQFLLDLVDAESYESFLKDLREEKELLLFPDTEQQESEAQGPEGQGQSEGQGPTDNGYENFLQNLLQGEKIQLESISETKSVEDYVRYIESVFNPNPSIRDLIDPTGQLTDLGMEKKDKMLILFGDPKLSDQTILNIIQNLNFLDLGYIIRLFRIKTLLNTKKEAIELLTEYIMKIRSNSIHKRKMETISEPPTVAQSKGYSGSRKSKRSKMQDEKLRIREIILNQESSNGIKYLGIYDSNSKKVIPGKGSSIQKQLNEIWSQYKLVLSDEEIKSLIEEFRIQEVEFMIIMLEPKSDKKEIVKTDRKILNQILFQQIKKL